MQATLCSGCSYRYRTEVSLCMEDQVQLGSIEGRDGLTCASHHQIDLQGKWNGSAERARSSNSYPYNASCPSVSIGCENGAISQGEEFLPITEKVSWITKEILGAASVGARIFLRNCRGCDRAADQGIYRKSNRGIRYV